MGPIAMLAAARARKQLLGLLWIGVLAGLVGATVTASLAGIRRTDTAADRLIAETKTPDAFILSNAQKDTLNALPAFLDSVPQVVAAFPFAQFVGRTDPARDWYYPIATGALQESGYAPIVDSGRMPAEDALDEVAISLQTSKNTGLGLGDRFVLDVYSPEQFEVVTEGTEVHPNGPHLEMTIVGIIRDPADIAIEQSNRYMLAGPALYNRYTSTLAPNGGYGVRLAHGDADLPALQRRLEQTFPAGAFSLQSNHDRIVRSEDANRVLRIGLLVMSAVAFVAGIYVVGQTIRRQLALDAPEDEVLRGLGLTSVERTLAHTLPGLITAATSVVVVAVAATLASALFPIGRPSVLEPHPGIHVNWAFVVGGSLFTGLITFVLFAFSARRRATERYVESPVARRKRLAHLATLSSLPPAFDIGVRFAVDRGRGSSRTPNASAIIGSALALLGVTGALLFGASLDHLTSTPAAYGIDYDLAMETTSALVDGRVADLAADDDISAVAEEVGATIRLGDRSVDVTALDGAKGSIEPVVREGRLPRSETEIALGPALLRDLGLSVGGQVDVGEPGTTRRMTIVGSTLATQVGVSDYDASAILTSTAFRDLASDQPFLLIVVRYADGVDADAKAAALDARWPYAVMDESFPAPPSALVNLDGVRSIPWLHALFFAALGLGALLHGLIVGVRQRRHELAMLRSLGFTTTQVRASVSTMASTTALVGLVVGVPLGVLAGATIWNRVAQSVDVVPGVVIPLVMALTIPLAVLIANLVAIYRARPAVRMQPAAVLRTE